MELHDQQYELNEAISRLLRAEPLAAVLGGTDTTLHPYVRVFAGLQELVAVPPSAAFRSELRARLLGEAPATNTPHSTAKENQNRWTGPKQAAAALAAAFAIGSAANPALAANLLVPFQVS